MQATIPMLVEQAQVERTPGHLAVIGGGVSGMTAASTWLRLHPENRVTVYEANESLGGWCGTAEGPCALETGARMLLNNDEAKSFYELCHLAGEMEGLVGSNSACRESFLVDASGDLKTEFVDVKDGLV